MKGQINIEYMSAALIYLLALFGLITVGSEVLPNFTSNVDQAALNMEAHHVSGQVLTQTGYSAADGGTENWHRDVNTLSQINSFGLANSSDNLLVLDRNKIQSIKSFPRDQPRQYFNYSQFKEVTGAENQYRFNFTWTPVIETHNSYHRGDFTDIMSSVARYRLEQENGPVEDSWNGYNGQTRSNNGNGPERGIDGIQNTKAFSFDGDDQDYVITQEEVEIPERYSIFTWIQAEESEQNSWTYAGGFNDVASLAVYGNDEPTVGLIVRNEDGDDGEWHTVWDGEPNILDGEWHHLGATVNRNTGAVKIYVDGEAVHEETIPNHWEGEQEIIMGGFRESTNHFTGKLDDFRIYEEVLSEDEAEDLYYRDIVPSITPPNTDYYRSSENIVRFGNETLNGQEYKFLVTAHNGVYNTTYVSESWDFTSKPPLGENDKINLYNNDSFTIDKIQQIRPGAGSTLILNQHLKEFGPNVDSDTTVIRMDRYGIMDNEPLRVEVLAW